MKPFVLTRNEAATLAVLALAGLIVPNGIFIYFAATDPALLRAALANPIAAVFIAEAFFMMFLFAWLIGRAGIRTPGPFMFIVLSVIGSMAFSVPAAIYLTLKDNRPSEPST